MSRKSQRLLDLSAALRIAKSARRGAKTSGAGTEPIAVELARREIAEFCRFVGLRLAQSPSAPAPTPALRAEGKLSPRMKQTLQRLLAGDSEKQVAAHLKISPHTIHVYVKAIYTYYNVSSRGELLALFVQPPIT